MLSFAFDTSKGETPQSIAQKRALVAQIMGVQRTPTNFGEGFSAIGDGIVANVEGGRAREAETVGRDSANSTFGALTAMLTGQGGQTPSSGYGSSPSVPSTADAASIRAGLIERGLPEHVADGFLMNFQDESGLNPGINEQNPTVPGSRGGYGLYQLTGPRRVAYEQYAAERGVDPSDVNAQLDFMVSELQGPEARAAQSIFAAPDAGSAAAAIARDFLRPAQQHLDERVARYTGGSAPVQVASLDPSMGLPAQLPPLAAPQTAQAAPMPAPAPQPAAPAPVQSAQGPSLQMLMEAAANPWLNDSQKSIINTMISEQMQQQSQANDPLRQLQIQTAQRALETPTEQWAKLDDNTLYNQATGEIKPIEGGSTPSLFEGTGLDAQAWNILQSADPSSTEYATAYSIIAQPKPQMVQTENGMMLVPVAPQLPAWLVPPSGAAPSQPSIPNAAPADTLLPNAQPPAPAQMPQGQSQANPSVFSAPAAQPANGMAGPGQLIPNTKKPSTEAQQRNEMLGTVLTSDLKTINDSFDALADPGGQLLSMIPGGLGNAWQSEEYQQAANAVSSSVANILYSVSGASANPGETENQIRNLTPQLGDKPGTIADKKRRLNIFVSAVAAASGNPELIAKAREESLRGLGEGTTETSPAAPTDIDALLQKYGTP